jgi:acetyl esterase
VTDCVSRRCVGRAAQTGSLNTAAHIENAIAKPLNKAMIEWFLDKLLRSPADKKDTRLDLVHAKLAGLPPVTIINAQIDPLRSDGEMLQDALKAAGVPVERKVYDDVAHGFFGAVAVIAKARQAQAHAGERLRAAFN